jgi:hypothetical protein
MTTLVLDVYSGAECCLCDDAKLVLAPLAAELDLDVRWHLIDGDPELEARWREQIPVGVLAGRKVFKYHVDPELLRRRTAELRA